MSDKERDRGTLHLDAKAQRSGGNRSGAGNRNDTGTTKISASPARLRLMEKVAAWAVITHDQSPRHESKK